MFDPPDKAPNDTLCDSSISKKDIIITKGNIERNKKKMVIEGLLEIIITRSII